LLSSKPIFTPPLSHPVSLSLTATEPNIPNPTGIIIAASVLVAAGIALYESPQVREWVHNSRRKIAIALHSLGDEIQPRRPSECSEDYEARRAEIIRQRRNALIRKAREEGIAVDLDELARIGREEMEMGERRTGRTGRTNRQRSFDEIVGQDGMLKREEDTATAAKATGSDMEAAKSDARRRGAAGFAAGSAAAGNPFSDDAVLFDRDEEDDAAPPNPFAYLEPPSRRSSVTVEDMAASAPIGQLIHPTPDLIDLTSGSGTFQPENSQTASIPPSETGTTSDSLDHTTTAQSQSFYSFTSSPAASQHPDLPAAEQHEFDSDIENVSAGTLTPRSERSAFTGVSVVGSQADDIAVLSVHNDTDFDARSEAFSEGGFSEVESQRGVGVMTPSSWTDVGSDEESEWGGPGQGNVHQ
jgi:hypothetical protein